MGQREPKLPNYDLLRQLGVDAERVNALKKSMMKNYRIIDEQDAVGSFVWYNLPDGVDGNLLEREIYYRGQICAFYCEELDKFFFLPFTYVGDIDCYGRFNKLIPLAFTGTAGLTSEDKPRVWMPGVEKKIIWDIPDVIDWSTLTECAIVLTDYTKQMPQYIIPRAQLQEDIIEIESEIPCYMRTALMNSVGIQGIRVNSQDEAPQVDLASAQVQNAALNGKKWVSVIGTVEKQELGDGAPARAEEFLLAHQAIDNLRMSFHGLGQGNLFDKKEHVLQSEQEMNQGCTGLILNDRMYQRQKFCDMLNAITGLGVYCMPSENAVSADVNMDGIVGDQQDQSGAQEGEQPNA